MLVVLSMVRLAWGHPSPEACAELARMAQGKLNQGRYDDAVVMYSALLERCEVAAHGNAYFLRAEAHRRLREYSAAAADYEKAAAATPEFRCEALFSAAEAWACAAEAEWPEGGATLACSSETDRWPPAPAVMVPMGEAQRRFIANREAFEKQCPKSDRSVVQLLWREARMHHERRDFGARSCALCRIVNEFPDEIPTAWRAKRMARDRGVDCAKVRCTPK